MSWLNNALNWAKEQVEGLNSWVADQVGDVWDGVGSTLGFETTAQKMRREQTEALTQAWQNRRQQLSDDWSKYKDEWTGTNGAQKATEMAKAATGSITAAQSEGAAQSVANAQKSVGINKSQAALSATNTAASTYADTFGQNLEDQSNQVNKQIKEQNEQMEDIYNKQSSLMDEQYQSGLADISSKKNSDLGLGASVNLGDIWGQYEPIKITSDENAKESLTEVNSDICVLQLMTILKDFEVKTTEDVALLKMALQFIDLWSKKSCYHQKEKE